MNTSPSFRRIGTLCLILSALIFALLLVTHYALAQDPQNGTPVDFVGTIDSLTANRVVIDGISVDIANVQISATLQVGMTIRVQGVQVQANLVVAQSITIIITSQTCQPQPQNDQRLFTLYHG